MSDDEFEYAKYRHTIEVEFGTDVVVPPDAWQEIVQNMKVYMDMSIPDVGSNVRVFAMGSNVEV